MQSQEVSRKPFSSYTPKQVTIEQIERLSLENGKSKLTSEKITEKCNITLKSLAAYDLGYKFTSSDEDLDINLYPIFNEIFKTNIDNDLLSNADALRLLRPDYQNKFQYDEKEIELRNKINEARYKNPNEKGCIGVCQTFEAELLLLGGFNKETLNIFFKLIEDYKFEELTVETLLEILPVVLFFPLENMRIHLLDEISTRLDEKSFPFLFKSKQDSDVDELLYWYVNQNDTLINSLSFNQLLTLFLKTYKSKLENLNWMRDLLNQMGKRLEEGTFAEITDLYLSLKKVNLLEIISWKSTLLNELKDSLSHDRPFVVLCREALQSQDKDLSKILGESFSTSYKDQGTHEAECLQAWLALRNAKV